MAKCPACEALTGALQSTPPHSKLKHIGQKKYKSTGWRTAYIDEYQCTECKTKWNLDTDSTDDYAGWAEG